MKFCTFDTALAKQYGINEAIILSSLMFWIEQNKANRKNFYDGEYWTYNTVDAWSEVLHFMTKNQIRTALESLLKQGAIITGNYNAVQYDRTLWYAVKPSVFAICENNKMDLRENTNGFVRKPTPIPVSYQENNILSEQEIGEQETVVEDTPLNSEYKGQIQTVIKKWNDTVTLLPKALRATKSRNKHINARILDYGLDTVLEAIEKVEDSEFLSGRGKWANCNIDWLFMPDNFCKVVEGKYSKVAKQVACTVSDKYKIVTGGGDVVYADKSGQSPLEYLTGDATDCTTG